MRCPRDIRVSPGSIPCMVRRESLDERCYLGNDCPGAGCPYAVTADRTPHGTMYIAVPAIRHHIPMPRTIMYRKGSPPYFGSTQNYTSDASVPRKHMVNACTQTTVDLLQDLVIVKKESVDESYRSECICKCQESYGSRVIVLRDSENSNIAV